MKVIFLLFLPFYALAHPGIGIVKDSKGNIYYSDLQQVWKISNGKKTIAVPGVHTHQLYIDNADNLYGENERTLSDTQFEHYLWVLRPGGQLDTLVEPQMAYLQMDYALSRDAAGNEYYIKQFVRRPDTGHIYKRLPDGTETIFAKGSFKGVSWLHPQADGCVLFVQQNHLYRASPNGSIKTVAQNIGSSHPTFALTGNSIIVYGIWQDEAQNVYAAAFSDQAVKKITPDGHISTYYQSEKNWAPTHGVFDAEGNLWLLESSDKNVARVTKVPTTTVAEEKTSNISYIPIAVLGLLTAGIGWYFARRGKMVTMHFLMP